MTTEPPAEDPNIDVPDPNLGTPDTDTAEPDEPTKERTGNKEGR